MVEASVLDEVAGQVLPAFNFQRGSTFLISKTSRVKIQMVRASLPGCLKGVFEKREFSGIINLTKCSPPPTQPHSSKTLCAQSSSFNGTPQHHVCLDSIAV